MDAAGQDPAGGDRTGLHWVAAWAAAPSDSGLAYGLLGKTLVAQTVRMVIHPSLSGDSVRIRLGHAHGRGAARVARATIAQRGSGAAAVPGTMRPLTFSGDAGLTLAAGANAISDAAELKVRRGEDLLVSLHVAGVVGRPTEHFITNQTSYVSMPGSGDRTHTYSGKRFRPSSLLFPTGWYFLDGVDVHAEPEAGCVVAFGDSITDGFQGYGIRPFKNYPGLDENVRYPDFLARRLAQWAPTQRIGVVNAGISGNQILAHSPGARIFGSSGLSRFDRDALRQPGVTGVIVLEGINDLGQHADRTAEQVIDGLRQLVGRASGAGVRVHLGTLIPAGGATGTYGTHDTDERRRAVNAWIRQQKLSDSVIDFDAALRDPHDPSRLAAVHDCGDHLHPNTAGYKAMAEAVSLPDLLARPARTSR